MHKSGLFQLVQTCSGDPLAEAKTPTQGIQVGGEDLALPEGAEVEDSQARDQGWVSKVLCLPQPFQRDGSTQIWFNGLLSWGVVECFTLHLR